MILWWLACAGPAEVPPPEAAPSPAPVERPAAPPPKARAFAYEGWPGEGIPVITTRAPLLADLARVPGGATAGPCMLAEGVTLDWERSVVHTDRPGRVRLTADRTLPAEAVSYGAETRLSREEARKAPTEPAPGRIGPDDVVQHLAYQAEGWCYYRINGAVVATLCFHDASEAAETSWWVDTRCGEASGWLRIDGRDELEVGRRF